MKTGRPSEYPNNEKGYIKFEKATKKYLLEVEKDCSKRPNVINWADYLGITRQTINKYQKRNNSWNDFIRDTIKSMGLIRLDRI